MRNVMFKKMFIGLMLLTLMSLYTVNAQNDGYYEFGEVEQIQCGNREVSVSYTIDQYFPAGQLVVAFTSTGTYDEIVPTNDIIFSGSTGTQIFPLAIDNTVSFTVIIYSTDEDTSDVVWSATISFDCNETQPGVTISYGFIPVVDDETTSEGVIPFLFRDGRVNHDRAAPMVVYSNPMHIYTVDPETSEGLFTTSFDMETEAGTLVVRGENPFTGRPYSVYLLNTGEYQLSTYYADGKPYIFVWDNARSVGYHLEK